VHPAQPLVVRGFLLSCAAEKRPRQA